MSNRTPHVFIYIYLLLRCKAIAVLPNFFLTPQGDSINQLKFFSTYSNNLVLRLLVLYRSLDIATYSIQRRRFAKFLLVKDFRKARGTLSKLFLLSSFKKDFSSYRSFNVFNFYLNMLNKRLRKKKNFYNNSFRKTCRKYFRKFRSKKKKILKKAFLHMLRRYGRGRSRLVFFSNFFLFIVRLKKFRKHISLPKLLSPTITSAKFIQLILKLRKFRGKNRWLSKRSIYRRRMHIGKSYHFLKLIRKKKLRSFKHKYGIFSRFFLRRGLKQPISLIKPIFRLKNLLRFRLRSRGNWKRYPLQVYEKVRSHPIDLKLYFKKRLYLMCKKKRSNFYFTVTNHLGEVILNISSGRLQKNTIKKRNRKLRSAFFNIMALCKYVVKSLKKKKIKNIEVFFKPSFLKFYQCKQIVYSFSTYGIKLRKIISAPRISHGIPPKTKKIRRL